MGIPARSPEDRAGSRDAARLLPWAAAVIVIAVFLSFTLSPNPVIKISGVGLAVAEVLAVSPFWHIPVIEDGADLTGVFGTLAVVAVLLGLASAAFRRRDIAR